MTGHQDKRRVLAAELDTLLCERMDRAERAEKRSRMFLVGAIACLVLAISMVIRGILLAP
jgi:hypothetical protein